VATAEAKIIKSGLFDLSLKLKSFIIFIQNQKSLSQKHDEKMIQIKVSF